ncbi:MAG: PLP-dependent aminotransferase family protein [Solirubrobacteraceae bacterium]
MSAVSAARLEELLGQWRRGGRAADRLAATVRALILDGQIPLQSQLPAERGLAAALGLSRATVTHAYNRLRAEGYIASQQGSGSWVTIPGGHGAAADAELAAGELDLRIAALPAPAIIEELSAAAAAELPRWLDHHGYDPLGLPPLRAAIAARFTARGLPTSPEQILVTNGALQALDIAIRALVAPGRTVLAEIPSYPAALDALRAARARLRTVPVTADGWDLDALESVAHEHKPALAYLMPDFQNPTGALIGAGGRRRAMRALRRAGTHVVIDETFVELGLDERPPAPMAAGDDRQTITIGSLSKSVWGGLRIGWARADFTLVRRLAAERAKIDLASPVLEQLLATQILEHLDDIVTERREVISARRAALMTALSDQLPQWRYRRPAGGLFLWAQLPDPVSTSLAVRAREHGLAMTPGPRFGSAGLLERYVRIPYSLPPDQLERAVSILARVAADAGGRVERAEAGLRYVA